MNSPAPPTAAQRDAELLDRIGRSAIERRHRRKQRRDFRVALAFMAPALLMVVGVLLLPVGYNIYLSFTRWKKFSGLDQFGGLSNYAKMLTHPYFSEALTNTAVWVGAALALPLLLGLGLALFVRGLRFENAIKNIIFIPRILAPTAVGVLWYYVYAPDGMVNRGLSLLTGDDVRIGWLFDDATITWAIIGTFVWQTVGLVMVLLLLGLSAIPKDPLEAARLDGATSSQVLRHIVCPLLLPTFLMVTILSILAGFTVFDLLWVMGAAYPGQRTLSLVIFMYFEAFQKGAWAFGSAVAVIIGLVALCATWVQVLLQKRVNQLTR